MLGISVSFFQHIAQIPSNICPICHQASECKKMMLAAIQATEE